MSGVDEYTLTAAEVAKMLGPRTQVQYVYNMADLPEGHPDRIPNYYKPRTNGTRDRRFRPEDVQAWIEAHK